MITDKTNYFEYKLQEIRNANYQNEQVKNKMLEKLKNLLNNDIPNLRLKLKEYSSSNQSLISDITSEIQSNQNQILKDCFYSKEERDLIEAKFLENINSLVLSVNVCIEDEKKKRANFEKHVFKLLLETKEKVKDALSL